MQVNPAALKALREHSGNSQAGLAERSGVSQGRISAIEASDKPTPIRPATAKRLAEALNVPVTAITVPEAVAS